MKAKIVESFLFSCRQQEMLLSSIISDLISFLAGYSVKIRN